MHFNLFATSMLLSVASAVEIESNARALVVDHPQAGVRPNANGSVKSLYHRPKDNCCHIYHGEGFSEEHEEPICWDMESGEPLYDQTVKAIKGIDCGKNTWVDIGSAGGGFLLGTAGRQHVDLKPSSQ